MAVLVLVCAGLPLVSLSAVAGPTVTAGDSTLRHDIQLLADYGVIRGPVSTWPLAWGPILDDIHNYDGDTSNVAVADAISRLRMRAQWATRQYDLKYEAHASAAEKPMRIRGYENTPRGNTELGGKLSWTGETVTIGLAAQVVDESLDDDSVRADGSIIGAALGNWLLSVNTLDRWWGPGWDGSIILSNNARPMPAISLDRNFTDAFRTRWLSWLGPWDLNVMMGQLEQDRVIPDALFFGMRFTFRPLRSLEIGLSRTAQWCGDGRPCDASTFADLLLGQDNRGDDGLDSSTEPGNQLAGLDFRWSARLSGIHGAFYGQLIGEDEAGGFPSRYLGQFGVEASGLWRNEWSWRLFGEFAGTSCQFYESSERFNCGYNHGVYQTGYRYKRRSIGHGADNDARVLSAGFLIVDSQEREWRLLLRSADLNRGGSPDPGNTLTATPLDLLSFDLSHSRAFEFGILEAGIGHEEREAVSGISRGDTRYYLQWRSAW